MPSYSWIFSDEDVDVDEEVEDATSVYPNNKKMLEKDGNIPVLRRSSRLAEQLTGQIEEGCEEGDGAELLKVV